VAAVIEQALNGYAAQVWNRVDRPVMEEDVDLDVTLESKGTVARLEVGIAQSTVEQNIQLVIGSSSMELWWKKPEEAPAKVQELEHILRAVAAGNYHERIEKNNLGTVVWGTLYLNGEVVTLETRW
jgi:hypothetical protein